MLKITINDTHILLSNEQIKTLKSYIKESQIEYEFIDGSDFDFKIKKRELAALIDFILSDENRDAEFVELIVMVLTELVQQKLKFATFTYVQVID